jgi:antitoxin HicB
MKRRIIGKKYTVSDGRLLLQLEVAAEGGYVVTSPINPELVTEAETVDEAFSNAKDALDCLARLRVALNRQLATRRPRKVAKP